MPDQVVRGSFALTAPHPTPKGGVTVTSSADFLMHISVGGVEPQFRGRVDVGEFFPPAGVNFIIHFEVSSGLYVGCVGAKGGETMIVRGFTLNREIPIQEGPPLESVLTVVTASGATVTMQTL